MNRKLFWFIIGAVAFCCMGTALAVPLYSGGVGAVASHAKDSLKGVALLVTAGSYVAGMGFAVGAVAKFKAHKDNPTQVPISMPIALLFVAAALIFIPSVFKTVGGTMYGASGSVAGVSGITSF